MTETTVAPRRPEVLQARSPITLRTAQIAFTVMVLVDTTATFIFQLTGLPNWGWFSVPHAISIGIIVVATLALVWHRTWLVAVITPIAVAMVFLFRPSGHELWLFFGIPAAVGMRGSRRDVVLAWCGGAAYSLAYSSYMELVTDRELSLLLPVFLAVFTLALGVGRVAHVLAARHQRRLAAVDAMRRQRLSLRRTVLLEIADDLQQVVSEGLLSLRRQVDAAAHETRPDRLRHELDDIGARAREVVRELRQLLTLLRTPVVAAQPEARRRLSPHLRRAITIVLGVATVAAAVFAVQRLLTHGSTDLTPLCALSMLFCLVVRRHTLALALGMLGLLAMVVALRPMHDWPCLVAICLVCSIVLGAERRARHLAVVAAGLLVVAVAEALLLGDVWVFAVGLYSIGVIGALTLTVVYFGQARAITEADRRALDDEFALVRSDQRSAVSRELHDVVGHQLSLVSVLVLSAQGSDDLDELRSVVHQIEAATDAAEGELATLVVGMTQGSDEPGRALVTVPAAIEACAERLSAAGFSPTVVVDADVDDLEALGRHTLVRLVQESTSNVMRHAEPASECRIAVDVSPSEVTAVVTSRLPSDVRGESRVSELSSGWGLTGLRERTELSGGSFTAGARNEWWVVEARLPRQ